MYIYTSFCFHDLHYEFSSYYNFTQVLAGVSYYQSAGYVFCLLFTVKNRRLLITFLLLLFKSIRQFFALIPYPDTNFRLPVLCPQHFFDFFDINHALPPDNFRTPNSISI